MSHTSHVTHASTRGSGNEAGRRARRDTSKSAGFRRHRRGVTVSSRRARRRGQSEATCTRSHCRLMSHGRAYRSVNDMCVCDDMRLESFADPRVSFHRSPGRAVGVLHILNSQFYLKSQFYSDFFWHIFYFLHKSFSTGLSSWLYWA